MTYTADRYLLAPAGRTVLVQSAEQWWDALGYVAADFSTAHPLCDRADIGSYHPADEYEADVIAYGLAAVADADAIEAHLRDAVSAYEARDLAATLAALNRAKDIEADYGDWPSTEMVASQALEEMEME